MRKQLMTALAILAAIGLGFLIGRSAPERGESPSATNAAGKRQVLYWVAPMDANYRRDQPGKSPMGMDLVPVYADEANNINGLVKIDATIVNNLGVRTAVAEFGSLSRQIETVGYVGYDQDTVQHLHTRVDGWIENLQTKASGDPVKKGQLLFELYSPTLVGAREEYLTAMRSGNANLLKASTERLQALGVNAAEVERLKSEKVVRRTVRVFADSDGIIANLGVREGIFVTPATEVMSVAELNMVWVMAEVFERQAQWVRAGQQAEVEFDYLPGDTWNAVVDYVYPELDPKTRTLTVRLRLDNAAAALRPNMYSRVTIHADGFDDVVHVPREAVIRGGTVDRVVIDQGSGNFLVQPVSIGIESGERIAIRRGIEAGTAVVVSGQFLIDSESNIASSLQRMDDAR